ncbi:MAG: hypothetical protein ACLPKE_22850 [Streptosporangiaceae bacterium]
MTAPGVSESAAGSPTSSCFAAAYVHQGRKPLAAKQPVLAEAQSPSVDVIPDPDVPIIDYARPEGGDVQQEETWANKGNDRAQSLESQANQAQNQVDLQTESNTIAADEVSALLLEDIKWLGSDNGGYAEDICNSIQDLYNYFGKALNYLVNLNSVVGYLNNLTAPNGTSAPNDLATAIQGATTKYQQTFGNCANDLDSIKWIVDQIHDIFCGEAE